jgi:hypothetical protein
MKNEETKRQPARDGVNSSFIILPSAFSGLAKGEIASLSGAGG